MDVIDEELGKLSFLDAHSSEFKYVQLSLSFRIFCPVNEERVSRIGIFEFKPLTWNKFVSLLIYFH
jgi:hypothetical protein